MSTLPCCCSPANGSQRLIVFGHPASTPQFLEERSLSNSLLKPLKPEAVNSHPMPVDPTSYVLSKEMLPFVCPSIV